MSRCDLPLPDRDWGVGGLNMPRVQSRASFAYAKQPRVSAVITTLGFNSNGHKVNSKQIIFLLLLLLLNRGFFFFLHERHQKQSRDYVLSYCKKYNLLVIFKTPPTSLFVFCSGTYNPVKCVRNEKKRRRRN